MPLLALARQTRWMERTARKITPRHWVTAALLLITQPQISLTVLAVLLGLLSAQTVSKQAVHERLDATAPGFLKAVLGAALGAVLKAPKRRGPKAVGPFARILIQDSTTIKRNEPLAVRYPGGANQHGRTPGVLRVQAVFELLSHRWLSFALSPYGHNDQRASPMILPLVRARDLVLRALGYFALPVLEPIVQRGAFFLSRFYFRTAVFDLRGRPLDLLALLRRQGRVDQWVWLGAKEKMRVRLVAVPAPTRVANERRRQARAQWHNRCQLSAAYLALQNWTVFVTNVPAERLSVTQVMALYGQRWQIEILFKGWKSHFHLEAVSHSTTAELWAVAVYGKLLFITLTHPLRPPALHAAVSAEPVRYYSRLKINLLTRQCVLSLMLERAAIDVAAGWERQMRYHGRYEKRQRRNLWETFFTLA